MYLANQMVYGVPRKLGAHHGGIPHRLSIVDESDTMCRKLLMLIASIGSIAGIAAAGGAWANDELMALSQDANNWAMWGRTYDGSRYSPLGQINKENASNLQVAWTFSTGVLRGHEGGPLVVGDTMWVHTPFPNKVFSIDLRDQTINWIYEPKQDAAVVPALCCNTVSRGLASRGLAYAEGKIFLQQADTILVALDAMSGEVIWKAVNGDPTIGETNTNSPVVVGDKVYTGISGGEFGVRGFLAAYNINDGSLVWKAYSTGPDEETLIDPEMTTSMLKPVGPNSSLDTWKGDQWKIGGGTTWGWYTYDPELNLIYYGTGNPSTWNPVVRPGDNKWSMTLFARDADTGMARWAYQMTPHDEWDYDGVNENILADIEIDGQMRKVLVHFDRNGFGYTLDRVTGELLVAKKYDPAVNWATHVDMEAGRPSIVHGTALAGTMRTSTPRTSARPRSAARTSSQPRTRRIPACSTCPPTTCAWTTSPSTSTTWPVNPLSGRRSACSRPGA